MNDTLNKQVGMVALAGAPNAGKSTLLNALLGTKISIVSPKVQTTRAVMRGILTEEGVQIIFLDTPGIFTPDTKRRLERAIVQHAWGGVADADLVVVMVDANRPKDEDTDLIIEHLKARPKPAIVVLNKIDKVEKEQLLDQSKKLMDSGCFEACFMISALKQDGTEDLKRFLKSKMPKGEWLYEEDQISTAPLRFLANEITREVLFKHLRNELPYELMVQCDSWKEKADSVTIHQTIYVMRESQKKIILGKHGAQIKEMGTKARGQMQYMFDMKVNLMLFVKVRSNWLDNPELFQEMGIDFIK